jgi:ParB family transcriptional regulator, chromosome partitioning protein
MKATPERTNLPHAATPSIDIPIGSFEPALTETRQHEDAPPSTLIEALLLDPRTVDPGDSPNRSKDAYSNSSYEALEMSILQARGNTQPIVVRPMRADEQRRDLRHQYLLISGSRRLHVCLQHGLAVQAVVRSAPATGHELIDRLVADHLREPLSPLEFGRQLQHFYGTHPEMSKRAVARLVGFDEGQALKALDLAALPQALIECFPNPNDLRYSDAKPLKDAIKAAHDVVLQEAAAIRSEGTSRRVSEIVERLTQVASLASRTAAEAGQGEGVESFNTPIEMDGKSLGEVTIGRNRRATIRLDLELNAAQRTALARHMEGFLRRQLARGGAGQSAADAKQPRGASPAKAAAAASRKPGDEATK